MNQPIKPTRGGARAGAGRKKRLVERKKVTFNLEPNDALRLKTIAKRRKITQVGWLADKIRRDKI
jgi:hypothetical protein